MASSNSLFQGMFPCKLCAFSNIGINAGTPTASPPDTASIKPFFFPLEFKKISSEKLIGAFSLPSQA